MTDCARFSRTVLSLQCTHCALTLAIKLGDMRSMSNETVSMPDLSDLEAHSLSVSQLTLKRGEFVLREDISFTLNPGDALFLTGRNGSGKTTLLRTLAGFLPQAGGEIALGEGGDPAELIAWLGHTDGLKPNETLRKSLRFWSGLAGQPGSVIMPVLKALDIGHLIDRPPARLSRGQQRRGAMARLAVMNRPFWLMDEPAGPLDRAGRERLGELVAWHRGRGGIVLAATHQDLDWPGAQRLELGGGL